MPKVLIIDDEPFTVEMLQTFLQIHSYTAIGALNGEDGIILSQVEAPDVLLLDLMLPDLDGFEVCRRLRDLPSTAHLPVLILSARTAQVDKDKALAAGANGYLTKPVRFPDLLSELKRLLLPPSPVEAGSSPASINGLLPAVSSPSIPYTNGSAAPKPAIAPLRSPELPGTRPSETGTPKSPSPKAT